MLCSFGNVRETLASHWVEKVVFFPVNMNFIGMTGRDHFYYFRKKLHPFNNFWTFETQNTEYNYIYQETYIYKKLKQAVEIYKNQTKNHNVLTNMYKVYTISTPFWNNFYPLLSIMECYKPNRWRMFCFLFSPLHTTRIVSALFGNLVNFLLDYQSIRVGSFS